MSRALREYQVLGIRTTIPFFLWLMHQPEYVGGDYDTTYLDRILEERAHSVDGQARASFNEIVAARGRGRRDRRRARRLHARDRGSGRRGTGWPRAMAAGRAPRGAARVIFEVELHGRMCRVSVERARPGRFHVSVDGTVHEVDATRVGEYGLSLLLDETGDRGCSSRELQVVPSGTMAELLVGLDGRTVPVSVNARRTRRGAADARYMPMASSRSSLPCRAVWCGSWSPRVIR